ncbi:MAG: Fic family protein [Syntrophaceae bacterium]|nr:Fic family protein [Syntrophaceae bacterium]
MKTLEMIRDGQLTVPMTISWLIADIGRALGTQEMFTHQSPQRLKLLREHSIVQSVISSNRIEGVEIDQSRVGTVIFGQPFLKDRGEEEVSGYRDALNMVHMQGAKLPVSEATILRLHHLCRGNIWDAGQFKEKPVDIIEKHADGQESVRFRSVSPENTPTYLRNSLALWDEQIKGHDIAPVIVLAALNLDFLCIHPFRDGNGRVSRLLLLLTCYHLGMEVGRYISLERLIEDHKERYYETLKQSSQGWHEGKHDPWFYIGFLLFLLKRAYSEFVERVGAINTPKGAKTEMIDRFLSQISGDFSISDIVNACPGVSVDMIRRTLKDRKAAGKLECLGLGRNARWRRNE